MNSDVKMVRLCQLCKKTSYLHPDLTFHRYVFRIVLFRETREDRFMNRSETYMEAIIVQAGKLGTTAHSTRNIS